MSGADKLILKSLIRNRIVPLELIANHNIVQTINYSRSPCDILMKQVHIPCLTDIIYTLVPPRTQCCQSSRIASINKKSQDSLAVLFCHCRYLPLCLEAVILPYLQRGSYYLGTLIFNLTVSSLLHPWNHCDCRFSHDGPT